MKRWTKKFTSLVLLLGVLLPFSGCEQVDIGSGGSYFKLTNYPASPTLYKPEAIAEGRETFPGYVYTRGLNDMSLAFSKKIIEAQGGNYVYSPISTWLAFELLLGGLALEPEAKLKEQLEQGDFKAAGIDSREDMLKLITYVQQMLNHPSSGVLTENMLILKSGEKWQEHFLDYASHFNAILGEVDLSHEEEARAELNAHLSERTNFLIEDFFDRPFSEDLMGLLVNLIYFNGEWEAPFSEDDTKDADFYLEDGSKSLVEMMYEESEAPIFNVWEGELGTYLRKEYKSGAFMVLCLPKEGVTPLKALKAYQSDTSGGGFTPYSGKIGIPKFEIETEVILNEIMKGSMGLGCLFDSSIEGKEGFVQGQPLYIDKALQKAVVKVDEKGTEAAAVTSILMEATAAPPMEANEIELIFDRPFAFTIMYENVELFEGIVVNPNEGRS